MRKVRNVRHVRHVRKVRNVRLEKYYNDGERVLDWDFDAVLVCNSWT